MCAESSSNAARVLECITLRFAVDQRRALLISWRKQLTAVINVVQVMMHKYLKKQVNIGIGAQERTRTSTNCSTGT
jgi:hypothetical protein